uniref:Uncharacterized protein n=1 Tax=Romanomermis culicivorax TaxID=13658 RepID=A0A915JLN0_ROMCU
MLSFFEDINEKSISTFRAFDDHINSPIINILHILLADDPPRMRFDFESKNVLGRSSTKFKP